MPVSRLDITNDDHDAYYEREGRELFGSSNSAKFYEQQLLEIL